MSDQPVKKLRMSSLYGKFVSTPSNTVKPTPAFNEAVSAVVVRKKDRYSAQVEGGWIGREAEEDLVVLTDRNDHSIFIPVSKLVKSSILKSLLQKT